jgi:tetratricopeptide (TPR) repeat protein
VSCDFVLPGCVDKRLWMGLERVEGDPVRGTTLREWMAPGPLGVDDAVRIALGIGDGMAHVAAAGLVHRDLKPENVLITREGFAKVTDLGLAEPLVRDDGGAAPTPAGTLRYMSPESWSTESPPSTAGDVYAFGVILWELLTGTHPFADSRVPLRVAHQEVTPADPRTLNPNASALLSRIALECLAKRAHDRPGFGQIVAKMREQWPAVSSCGQEGESNTGVGTMCNRVAALMTLGHLGEAEHLIERARRAAPDHPFVHAQRAKLLCASGKLDEARESLETVARLQSTSPGMLILKSEALMRLGQSERAIAVLDQARVIEPTNGWCLYQTGMALMKLGRDEEARQVLTQCAMASTESGVLALVALAEIERLHGNGPGQWIHLTAALKQNPNSEEALVHLGRAVADAGDLPRALQYAERAVELNPDMMDGRLLRADLLERSGHVEKAEEELRAHVARWPGIGPSWARLGTLLHKTGRAAEASTCFEHAANAQPRNASDYVHKAALLGSLRGRWRDAIASLDAALALEPGSVPAFTLKAEAHTYFGESAIARQCYSRALALRPGDREVAAKLEALDAFERAETLRRDHPDTALDFYSRALELEPRNLAYLISKAATLAAVQRPGEALPLFDQGVALAPDALTPQMRWSHMQCLQMLHLIGEAQSIARKTLPLVTDDRLRAALQELLATHAASFPREQVAAHWFAAGIKAQQTNRLVEAVEFLRRAVYVAPSNPVYLGACAMALALLGVSHRSVREKAEAFSLFERSLEMQQDPIVLFNYAQALHMTGRLSDALRVATDLLALTPADPHLLAMIATITARQSS